MKNCTDNPHKLRIIPIILAGGSGKRLWPLSRLSYPKQFLRLVSKYSLFQETLLRVKSITHNVKPIIVGSEAHYFLCLDQLNEIEITSAINILEPVSCNTAPAIAIAALEVLRIGDPLVLVMPSDHLIKEIHHLTQAIKKGIPFANQGKLITFSINATCPKTGYGYIKVDKEVAKGVYSIQKFIEKPSKEKAKALLANNSCYWNGGIFLFKPSAYLEDLRIHAPDIYYQAYKSFLFAHRQKDLLRLDKKHFALCRNESIDYAIMEKTKSVLTVPISATWTDLGSWESLYEAKDCDNKNNVIRGNVLALDTTDSLIFSQERLTASLGIKNHIIVTTKDAVLVMHKNHSQKLSQLLSELSIAQQDLPIHSTKREYKWGSHEDLLQTSSFQINHLMIKPNSYLTLPSTPHKTFLIIVDGEITITYDNKSFNQESPGTAYIPQDTSYRLENSKPHSLYILEIQVTRPLKTKELK